MAKRVISCGVFAWRIVTLPTNDNYGYIIRQILLVRSQYDSNPNRWGLPKGKIESGETFEECAKREVLEEAGIAVGDLQLQLKNAYLDRQNTQKCLITFLSKVDAENSEPATRVPDEIAEAKWWNIHELPELYAYQREVIEHGISVLEQGGIKV